MLNSHIGEFLARSLGQKPQVSQMVGAALPGVLEVQRPALQSVIKSSNLGQGLSVDSKEAQARESSGKARERLWPLSAKGCSPCCTQRQRAVQWWEALNWSLTLLLLKGANQ